MTRSIPVPPEVRRAARAVIGDHVPMDTITEAIAAALAAWPGVDIERFMPGSGRYTLHLPLPQEPRNDTA